MTGKLLVGGEIMYELKTKENDSSPEAFISKVTPDKKREQAFELLTYMTQWTGYPPKMWGESIIGFGKYTYHYRSGHSGEWLVTGFSPRKVNLTVYILPNLDECLDLLEVLGKHKRGKGCIYINKLEDVDLSVLEKIVKKAYRHPLVIGD